MDKGLVNGMLVLLLLVSGFEAMELNSIKETLSTQQVQALPLALASAQGTQLVQAASSSGGGETYDQMMARMHPEQAAQQQAQTAKAAAASGGAASALNNLPNMVGGC